MLACREGGFKAVYAARLSAAAVTAQVLCKFVQLHSNSPLRCAAFTEMPSGCGDKGCVRIECVSRVYRAQLQHRPGLLVSYRR